MRSPTLRAAAALLLFPWKAIAKES